MALKDRNRRRLARLGVIRLGKKVPNKSGVGEHPIQTDYFVLKDAPDVAEFYAAEGITEVRSLGVRLPYPDIERNFDASYQVWAGGVLVCQGDGEHVQYATPHNISTKTKNDKIYTTVHSAPGDTLVSNGEACHTFKWNGAEFRQGDPVPCPGRDKDLYPHCVSCKLNAVLKVMMSDPRLFRFGYYQISTGSGRNYDTIMGTLELMPEGRVNAMPFILSIVPGQITYMEGGQRKKTTKHFLQLEPDPAVIRALYERATDDMLAGPQERVAIPAQVSRVDFDEDPLSPPPYAVAEIDIDVETGEIVEPHKWTMAESDELYAWYTGEDIAITTGTAMEALEVARLSEYTGDLESAKQKIRDQLNEWSADE